MKFRLNRIEDKENFHIEKCREFGEQRINNVETFWKNVEIANARIGGILCYQNEKTRLFDYSDKKIKNIEMTFNEIKIETENKIYCFSSEIK